VDRRTGLARVFGCRSWSTVRRLGLPRYLDPVALELLGGPVRHSLETLRIASPALLGGLAHWRGPRLELRELTYTHDHFRANTDPLPVRFDGELVVRTLRVVHHQEDPGRWIELARTMPALDELELELRDRQRPADVRALVTRAATTGLRRFVVGLPPVFAHWERTAGGELLCSRVELRPQHLPLQDAEVIRLSRLLALVDTRAAQVAIAIPDVPEHPEATTRIRELDQLVRGARVVRTPAPARTAISPRRR
jgi:hypothetical protein